MKEKRILIRLMNEQRWHCERPTRKIQVPASSEVDEGINPRCSLIITELERTIDRFKIVAELTIGKPEVQLFLGHDFISLVINTRAVCV